MSKKTVKEVTKKSNVIYIGPTITGVVRHFTVFKDGVLPEKVTKCTAELPMMKRLFINKDYLPTAVKELREKQSALSTIYVHTAKKFQ